MTLKLYKEQNKLPFEKNWANEILSLQEHCNISLRNADYAALRRKAIATSLHVRSTDGDDIKEINEGLKRLGPNCILQKISKELLSAYQRY